MSSALSNQFSQMADDFQAAANDMSRPVEYRQAMQLNADIYKGMAIEQADPGQEVAFNVQKVETGPELSTGDKAQVKQFEALVEDFKNKGMYTQANIFQQEIERTYAKAGMASPRAQQAQESASTYVAPSDYAPRPTEQGMGVNDARNLASDAIFEKMNEKSNQISNAFSRGEITESQYALLMSDLDAETARDYASLGKTVETGDPTNVLAFVDDIRTQIGAPPEVLSTPTVGVSKIPVVTQPSFMQPAPPVVTQPTPTQPTAPSYQPSYSVPTIPINTLPGYYFSPPQAPVSPILQQGMPQGAPQYMPQYTPPDYSMPGYQPLPYTPTDYSPTPISSGTTAGATVPGPTQASSIPDMVRRDFERRIFGYPQSDIEQFIASRAPRPPAPQYAPRMTPMDARRQLEEINRLYSQYPEEPMQFLRKGGAVKKFSDGGPAGSSSSGVRRLEMSRIRKRQEGSPSQGEISDDMFVGTRPTDFPETSPVDTAVSDFISSRSKLVTDPREFFRVMGENIEEYHGKPLREDPEKYLMEQLGPGALGGIIKPKGGNVVTQDLMESLNNLRPSVLFDGYRPASDADKLIREQMKKEEESGRGVTAITRQIFEENKPKAALDDWIQNKLGRYIRTEMGSEDDPVRKLGEEMTEKIRSAYEAGLKRIAKMKDKIAEAKAMGKNTDISEAELADEINRVENAYRQTSKLPVDQGPYLYPRSRTGRAREKAGFSPYPISKSDAGKEWEGTADALFEVHKAGDLVKQNSPLLLDNPWIAKLDPKEIVYQPKNVDEPAMFTHTIDELENALNPNSGLPQNFLLKPEDMQQLSIDKAFRHVNKINDWRMQQRTAANLQEAQLAAVTYKEYPGSTGKLKWQELKAPEYTELPPGYRLEDMDYGTAMLKDAQGNILTYIDKMNAKGAVDPLKQALSFLSRNDLERALKYEGSTMRHCVGKYCDPVFLGQTRVFSLRDLKGEPHITIETAPPQTTSETIDQFFRENPSLKRTEGLDDFQYANSPAFPWKEYDQWLKSQPEEVRQVKGKGNDKPSARYIEFGQDFIASKNWSDIKDLENLDIVPLKPMLLKNAQERGFNPQILTTVKDQPYITKQEFNRLANLFGGMNKYAAGGEVTDFIKRAA